MIRLDLFTGILGTPSIPSLEHIMLRIRFIIHVPYTEHVWWTPALVFGII